MAASEITICSNALLELGANPISSFEEATQSGGLDRARLCSNLWPSVRDAVLRSHPWNCATKRVVLSPDTEAPAYDYIYQFTVPGDWLRTLVVGYDGQELDYRQEGKRILCESSVLPLRYIWQNTNVASYDAMLQQALQLAMVAKLTYPITKSTSEKDVNYKIYTSYLRQVRAVDGEENPPETLGDFPLLQARYTGGG
jgi:hypothetical protein